MTIKVVPGQRFGRLVVVSEAKRAVHEYPDRPTQHQRQFNCLCDCGTATTSLLCNLRSGHAKSCGCMAREITAVRSTKHGHARRGHQTAEHVCWAAIKQRCYDPKVKSYKYYGARGIRMCQRWLDSFDAFFEDMGPKPWADYSIDRIDPDGNYEPSNCRWADRLTQRHNRSTREAMRDADDGWIVRRGMAKG